VSRPRRAAGLACAVGAAGAWLAFLAATGPATGNDTEGYVRLARALGAGRVITSFRTPGYPLLLAALHGTATLLRVDAATLTAVVQTLCLAGAGTWLVFALGARLSGRTAAGVVAALLYAGDADLQQFGTALLTEAPTVVLALAALAWRVHDGGWRRAAWLLAALALVRPNFAVFPLVFAPLEAWRLRRAAPALALLAPTVLALSLWWVVSLASGANPWRPYQWFVPVHTFGTVYEADLWRRLPDGPDRALVARLRARGVDPYAAVAAVERERGAGSAGRIAREAVAAAPGAYVATRAALLRQVFRQGSFLRPELIRFRHPDARALASLTAWRDAYRRVFYASFPLFVLLLALGCTTGLGWPAAAGPFRWALVPFVAVLFVSTAMGSLSNYDVGRLGLAFRPVNALCWALGAVAVAARAAASWPGRAAAPAE
jgi:hypothetical protein